MKRAWVAGLVAAAALLGWGAVDEADAACRVKRSADGYVVKDHPRGCYSYARKRTAVRGYVARRGGYSYYADDSINTYGDSRSIYGGTQAFRNWQYDRQTSSGPFDHGFFFDSGVHPRGGDSPYMH